jgi:ribosomal protein S18 acetylase RimI-like enzyme
MDYQNCWMRVATTADAAAVAAFAEMTFRATYGDANTPEDMELYCRNTFSESLIAKDIAMPYVQYQLAIANDELVGFIKLQWSTPPMPMPFERPLQISRIYVQPQAKGKGIGRILMAAVKGFASENHHDYIWLGVWQQNEDAIAFYKKMGFAIVGTDTFLLGQDLQLDWLMGMPVRNM